MFLLMCSTPNIRMTVVVGRIRSFVFSFTDIQENSLKISLI